MFATPERRRRRILLMAYACRPEEGSEPGLGWNRAVEAAKTFDTWVICNGTRSEKQIRGFLQRNGDIPGLNFSFVAEPRMQTLLKQVPGGFYPGYRLWQKAAFKRAQQLHREVDFDLVHQATYCGYREPGYTWKLPIPFVWGGIGGTHNYPWSFLAEAGVFGAISESARTFINTFQMHFSPRVRSALKASALTMAGNTLMQRHLREVFHVEAPLFPASGIGDILGKPRQLRANVDVIRLLWCGYLHPLKGLSLLLRALAQLPPNVKVKLRVVGDGPHGPIWKKLANRLGVSDYIEWTGRIPHHEALDQYKWADAFICTSLRETLPGVVLESLAAGLPVITMDHLGMGDAVTTDCGIKVPVTTPRDAIARFATAIPEIVADPARWEAMSRAAIDRAEEYTWSHQGRRLVEIYSEILGDRASSGTKFRPSTNDTVAVSADCELHPDTMPAA